jgi:hypothetical protein
MVGSSTRRALNSRALRAADWIHDYAKHLEGELEKQNIEVHVDEMLRNNSTCGSITKDGIEAMVTFKASALVNLIVRMYREEAELRRFTEPPKLRHR